MKKIFALLMSAIILLSFVACNKADGNNTDTLPPSSLETTEYTTTVPNPDTTDTTTTIPDTETTTAVSDTQDNTTETAENPAFDFEYEFTEDQQYALINKYIGKDKNVIIPSQIEGRTVTFLKGHVVDGDTLGVFQGTDIETVVIPETVKAIGPRTFKDCTALTCVTIQPNSKLQQISILAFENCTSLKVVNIENAEGLKTIGAKAFNNCTSIEKIKLPSNLEAIGVEAFTNCTALRSINIPTKLELMNFDGARFYNVTALEEIIFDDGWQSINGYVFFAITSKVNIIIPKSVTSINVTLFVNTGEMNMFFSGDCPQITGSDKFMGNVIVHYDPSTSGWDSSQWASQYQLIPIT